MMKYKTLVRLALEVLGVYLLIESLQTVLHFGVQAVAELYGAGPSFPGSWLFTIPQGISGALQIGIGLYLFFGGKWIVNLAIPSNRPYCQECAYDLTGAATTRCPECGTPFRWEDVMPAGHASPPAVPTFEPASSRDESGKVI